MITTIICPKGNGDQVNNTTFLFFCIFKGIIVALPPLLTNLITSYGLREEKRSLPYAAVLTAFEYHGIDLSRESYDELLLVHVHNRKVIERFMYSYEIIDGVVQCHLDSSDEASDGDAGNGGDHGTHGKKHVEIQGQDVARNCILSSKDSITLETSGSQAQHDNVGHFCEWHTRSDSQLQSLGGEARQINMDLIMGHGCYEGTSANNF